MISKDNVAQPQICVTGTLATFSVRTEKLSSFINITYL
jgi:hypothetical protein